MNATRADIHPLVDLDPSQARAVSYASVNKRSGVLGNGFLEMRVDIDTEQQGRVSYLCKGTGELFHLDLVPLRLWLGVGKQDAGESRFLGIDAQNTAQFSRLTLQTAFESLSVEISYVLQRGYHFVQKSMVIHGVQAPARLHRASLFRQIAEAAHQVLLHDSGMYYPVVFLRGKKNSLFFCVDFPGYIVTADGPSFEFSYYPGADLEPGRGYRLLTSHVGMCELTGRFRENPYHETAAALDVGEQQWFREYMTLGRPVTDFPFLEIEAPGAGIAGPSELEVLDQCAWLGAKHVLMPRIVASLDSHPLASAVKNRIRDENIHAALLLRRDMPDSPVPRAGVANQGRAHREFDACISLEEIDRILIDRYLALVDRHGLRDAELTGRPIRPHDPENDGEPVRMESIQRAFQGLVEIVATLREESSHITCFGTYGSYGVGVARLSDGISLMADDHPLALPDLHVGRLFADMQRLYFRRSLSFLLPRANIVTSIGLVPHACPDAPYPGAEQYPWYLYHDSAGWRYGLISAIALGLCHRFQAVPHDLSPEDRAFAVKWLAWEKEHLAEARHVNEILSEPGLNAVDGYSYATPRGAIVFLFNTGWGARTVELRLRLVYDSDYVVREVYPREMNYLGPEDGLFRKDSAFQVDMAAKEARIIEVVRRSPASARRKRPEVFGAEAKEDKGLLSVLGEPGTQIQVGVRIGEQFKRHDVRFPGKPVEKDITEWAYVERLYEQGRVALPQGSFAGKALTPDVLVTRNVWLSGKINVAAELEARVDTTPFALHRPCWTYPDRLFCVIRFEPASAFDPIRTCSGAMGEPEGYERALPIKCGFDLTPLNLRAHAWINGVECPVYPSLAAWTGYTPNPYPVVAYFFEATSALRYGYRNQVVLYMAHFDPKAFRGVHLEHMPRMFVEKTLE